MHIEFLRQKFAESSGADALVWHNQVFTYQHLLDEIDNWFRILDSEKIEKGSVVSIEADFSPRAIALMLALVDRNCVIVPLSSSVANQIPEFREIAQVEVVISFSADDVPDISRTGNTVTHPVLLGLKNIEHPGLILFSSGSTGKSKAAVHDFVPMLQKYKLQRHSLRTITFLLFDHIGGVNTLLYNLSNAGCVITVADRRPETVCETIDKYGVELLPTSPTFLNLMLMSGALETRKLDSLKMITYGTEVMPESTLARIHELLPNVKLLQTYGLSEVGILRSKSKSSDSLWVQVGGEGFETRIVDGLLEIRAESAMLGYLNAPSPFTDDGWFKTGDAVEVDGEYIKILGRKSEIINVGGEKVYPAEIESILQTMDGVVEVVVSAEPHPLTGNIVVARVKLSSNEDLPQFRKRMREFCSSKLARFKVPQKVELVDQSLHGERFKKMRKF
ncbi:MAG TPA: fatty acid--CoA ligase family protein [Woeseiaceae bacterium]|nr:fatty acid--CoA ligase family protein [Woeseiaceae bacterium]